MSILPKFATPFPQLGTAALRHAYDVLTGPQPAARIEFDGRRLGIVTLAGIPVDTIRVKLADLLFIHSADPSRFGTISECPVCEAQWINEDGTPGSVPNTHGPF
jgi:hypothetical protein